MNIMIRSRCFLTHRLLAGLLSLMSLVSAVSSASATDLRVMSFNIRYGSADDGDNRWPLRRALVAETIRRYQPDLLGMQEVQPVQVSFLKEQFSEYQYIGWSRDASAYGEQCGVMIRTERFDIVNSGQFWLSETPEIRYSKSWDSSLPRVCTWVRVRDRGDGNKSLLFANTHFDHRGMTARGESGKLIARRLGELARDGEPVILAGDFNCGQDSPAWNSLVGETGLADTYLSAADESEQSSGTFHGFRGLAGSSRIDWILCSRSFTVVVAAIDRHHTENRYPSDHFPVTAVLRFR